MEKYNTKEKVHNHAKKIIGIPVKELQKTNSNLSSKNSMGDIFESWFGKEKDSSSSADLPEAGVELKTTPYKKLKNGQISAKERLVLNIINYNNIINEDFFNSHFLSKNKKIELAFYEHNPNVPRECWSFNEVILYEMEKNPVDLNIIKQDWEKITEYVKKGKAHELSESLTNYLSACTKGANRNSVRSQPCSNILAKQRAYSLKSSYMTSLLRKYIFGDEEIDSIIKDNFDTNDSFDLETIIHKKFKPYIGMSINELAQKFNINTHSYQTNYLIAAAILNISGKITRTEPFPRVDEFEKASIKIKTVRFNNHNDNKESMSFPEFKFKELVLENWQNDDGTPGCDWHNFLLETRFLFFVTKLDDNNNEIFKGIKFFSIPISDIEGPIKYVWENTKQKLLSGVRLTAKKYGDKIRIENNFIKKSDGLIIHVRPHASRSDYSENGPNANELPSPAEWVNKPNDEKYSDNWMTKQSFWLNNDYIKKQVEDLLD